MKEGHQSWASKNYDRNNTITAAVSNNSSIGQKARKADERVRGNQTIIMGRGKRSPSRTSIF